jgi:hypothetical protein
MNQAPTKKVLITGFNLPELSIYHELHEHRRICHGSEIHDLVLCTECARLEGELEQLTRFLDSPTPRRKM